MKKKKGKLFIIVSLLPIIVIFVVPIIYISIMLVSYLNNAVEQTDSGWYICHNIIDRNAFIGHSEWDGNYENMTFTVPDSYKNCRITALGGYYGHGGGYLFGIMLPDEYGKTATSCDPTETPAWYPNGYTIIELKFTLNIGPNIKKIVLVDKDYIMHLNEDGSYLLYHPVYYINCSEKNKTFYSKDGKLYYKTNNLLVDNFAYPTNN